MRFALGLSLRSLMRAVLARLEDYFDRASFQAAIGEPSRDYEEFLAEMEKSELN